MVRPSGLCSELRAFRPPGNDARVRPSYQGNRPAASSLGASYSPLTTPLPPRKPGRGFDFAKDLPMSAAVKAALSHSLRTPGGEPVRHSDRRAG